MKRVLLAVLGYGARLPDTRALRAMLGTPGVSGVLVFWNAPTAAVRASLAALAAHDPAVSIDACDDNLGSAGGYRRLLQWAASRDDWDYLLLLDDDLEPRPGSIDRLVAAASSHPEWATHTLFLAYRPGLPELAALVDAGRPLPETRPGACVGFHVANLLAGTGASSSSTDAHGVVLRMAPYGGLFIPRATLARLGLPSEVLFLYADDSEWTLRFTRAGGTIRLVPDASVADRFPAWNASASHGGNLARRVLHLDDTKAYYEARNRNFLARRYHPGRTMAYRVNKFVFLAGVYVLGAINGRLDRARLIHKAVVDGEQLAAST